MNYEILTEIRKLRTEFEKLPEKGKLDLGSRGMELLSKIHKLEVQLEMEQ